MARSNEGWPRSAARQGTTVSFGRHGGIAARRRALVAASSSMAGRGRLDGTGKGEVSGRACALERGQWRGQAAGTASSAAAQQAHARACLSVCARREGRVSEGEREGREKGSGERKRKVHGLTQFKLKIFN